MDPTREDPRLCKCYPLDWTAFPYTRELSRLVDLELDLQESLTELIQSQEVQ